MHTSQTTHHRIFFANVTKPDYLEGLCMDLGLEKISDTVYDLVLSEGTSLSVEGACRIAVKVAALGNEEGDPEDLQFMLGCLARLLAERRYTPHSTTFDADVDLELLVDQDISCLELFDLLSALSYGYEVRGIYSQWAMTSNKAAFGANAGGTRITMRDFSIPCSVYPDDAEGLIFLLAQHRPENIGDIFLMKLILPLIEMPGILNKTMERSVHAALARHLGGVPLKRIEDIIPEHLRPSDVFPISPGFINSTLESMERQGIDPRDIEIKGVHLRDSRVPEGFDETRHQVEMIDRDSHRLPRETLLRPDDVLDRGRDVIDRETHRPIANEKPSIPSVMVLEKTGPDYSEVSSSRQSFAEPSPPPSSDNNSSPTSD